MASIRLSDYFIEYQTTHLRLIFSYASMQGHGIKTALSNAQHEQKTRTEERESPTQLNRSSEKGFTWLDCSNKAALLLSVPCFLSSHLQSIHPCPYHSAVMVCQGHRKIPALSKTLSTKTNLHHWLKYINPPSSFCRGNEITWFLQGLTITKASWQEYSCIHIVAGFMTC